MMDFPDISSVDSFTTSDFYNQYLLPLMHRGQENAVVFLQDKLSVDDFTKYADVYSIDSDGGAFKNVRRLMEDHYSLEVPQVDSPHVAVEKLMKNFDGKVHMVDGLPQLKSLKLADGKRFLLIVNLHPVIGSGDEEKAITDNDAVVGDVTRHLHDSGIKYSALFTGKSAQGSDDVNDPSNSIQHSNRHLLAPTAAPQDAGCAFMNVSNEVYVFLCGLSVCVKGKDDPTTCVVQLNTTATENMASSSKRNNNTADVVLQFDKLKDAKGAEYSVKIVMALALQQDRWIMVRNSLYLTPPSGTGNKTSIQNATLINYELDTVIPRLYSFHCSGLKLFVETVKDTTFKDFTGTRVTLERFQLQVFDIANNRFFYAQDCVGFFTAGIWMGIVPGLLLIFIMVYGTMMILNLSVMDKFDDPKGKTITVNVAGD